MKTIIYWKLPIKTVSESNVSEHWTKKAKRHTSQKRKIRTEFIKEKPKIKIPCNIIITRIAPRQLDKHDNLPVSLKWIVDAVAENILTGKATGRADDCKEITWEYRQIKGNPNEYAVGIEFSWDSK